MTSDDVDLEQSIDALYDEPPENFVAQREALARQLRAAKRREEAATVHALTRPTVAAWAVNQAIRRAPALGEQLIDSTADLVEAQRRAVEQGDATALRAAQATRRAVVRDLVDRARQVLQEQDRPSDSQLDDITSILESASLDPQSKDRLRSGQLASAPKSSAAPDQLDALASLFAPAPGSSSLATTSGRAGARSRRGATGPADKSGARAKKSADGPTTTDEPTTSTDDSEQEAAAARRQAEAAREQAEAALQQTSAEAEQAEARVVALADRAHATASAAEEARTTVEVLERQLAAARRSLDTAENERSEAANALEQAQEEQRAIGQRLEQAKRVHAELQSKP